MTYWRLIGLQQGGEVLGKVQSLSVPHHLEVKAHQMEEMKVCYFPILRDEKVDDIQPFKVLGDLTPKNR